MTDSNDTPIQLELPLTDEEWRDIPGYEGLYQVSDLGNVRRSPVVLSRRLHPIQEKTVLTPGKGLPYLYVNLSNKGKAKSRYVHRLVMLAFVGECPTDKEVNHKNGIKTDNRLENLEYVTPKENIAHSINVLGRHPRKGERNGRAKLTNENVREIRRLLASKVPAGEIAARFKMSSNTIWAIKARRRWGHLKDE